MPTVIISAVSMPDKIFPGRARREALSTFNLRFFRPTSFSEGSINESKIQTGIDWINRIKEESRA
jgi:hypothetical protein